MEKSPKYTKKMIFLRPKMGEEIVPPDNYDRYPKSIFFRRCPISNSTS